MAHIFDPGISAKVELGPVGKRGAVAAPARLEKIEERAHARLPRTIESGNQFQIKAAQEFYLRASESLRRLDLALRLKGGTQRNRFRCGRLKVVSAQISIWLRTAFERFLSAESPGLMGIKDLGEFKFSAIERFRGILHRTVKGSLKVDPIPAWAATKVIEAWNVPTL